MAESAESEENKVWGRVVNDQMEEERREAFGSTLLTEEQRQQLLQHPETLNSLTNFPFRFAGVTPPQENKEEEKGEEEQASDAEDDPSSPSSSNPLADSFAAQSFADTFQLAIDQTMASGRPDSNAYLLDVSVWDEVLTIFEENWEWILSNRISTQQLLSGKSVRQAKDKVVFSKVYNMILENVIEHGFHEGPLLFLLFFGAILFSVGTPRSQRNTRLVWIERGQVAVVLRDFFRKLRSRTLNPRRREEAEEDPFEGEEEEKATEASRDLDAQLHRSCPPPPLPSLILGDQDQNKRVSSLIQREDYSRALQEFDRSKVLSLTADVRRQLLDKHPKAVGDTPCVDGRPNYLAWLEPDVQNALMLGGSVYPSTSGPLVATDQAPSSPPSSLSTSSPDEESARSVPSTSPLPPSDAPTVAGLPGGRLTVTRDLLDKSLKGLSKNSAPGPTGLRYEHLLWFLTIEDARFNFCKVVEAVLNGEVPPRAKQILIRGSLTALDKGGGKVRPICVCESVRKIASRIALASMEEQVKAFFAPIQVGVGTRNGSESIFHESSVWWAMGRVVGTVDISNAFNSFDRRAVMLKTFEHFPSLFSYVKFLYEDNNQLLVQPGEFISSERGAVQGDPLSPFLFALVIQNDLKAVKEETGVDMCAYCDDVSVFHQDIKQVAKALGLLVERFKRSALSCNLEKSKILCFASEEEEEDRVALSRRSLQDEVDAELSRLIASSSSSSSPSPPSDPVPSTSSAPSIPVELVPGFKTMGGYVGEQSFVESELKRKVEKISLLIDQILAFGRCGYVQHAYALLKLCIVPKFNHIVRLQGREKSSVALRLFDSKVVDSLCLLLGLDSSELRPWQRETIHLPVRYGGFGLPSMWDSADIAHYASLKECKVLIEGRVKRRNRMPVDFANSFKHEFDLVSKGLQHLLKPNVTRKIQKELMTVHTREKLKALLAIVSQEDYRYEIRTFFLAKLGQFSKWLNIMPVTHTFLNDEFVVASRVWMGVKHFAPCVRCDSGKSDLPHLLSCAHGPYVDRRHNTLYKLFANAAMQSNIWCRQEPHGVIGRVELDEEGELENDRRPDLYFPNLNGSKVVVDVTFSSPWRSLGGRRAYFKPSLTSVVDLRESEKLRAYQEVSRELVLGQLFFPVGAEALGVIGKGFRAFLSALEKALWRPIYRQLLVDLQVFFMQQLTWAIPKLAVAGEDPSS